MLLGLFNIPHSGCVGYLNDEIANIEDESFLTKVVIVCIALVPDHIAPATIHIEVVIAHIEVVTAHIEDTAAYIEDAQHAQRL